MSTRGLWGFHLNAKDYLTYNHSDSYPEELGTNLCKEFHELLKQPGLLSIIDLVHHLRLVHEDDEISKEELARLKKYPCLQLDTDTFKKCFKSLADWYHLLREIQGNIANTLEIGVMIDNHTFTLDSLFCEWVYIFNLDTLELEIYTGYTTIRGKGRYSENSEPNEEGYYPCTLRHTISFYNLPKSMEHKAEQILFSWF